MQGGESLNRALVVQGRQFFQSNNLLLNLCIDLHGQIKFTSAMNDPNTPDANIFEPGDLIVYLSIYPSQRVLGRRFVVRSFDRVGVNHPFPHELGQLCFSTNSLDAYVEELCAFESIALLRSTIDQLNLQ